MSALWKCDRFHLCVHHDRIVLLDIEHACHAVLQTQAMLTRIVCKTLRLEPIQIPIAAVRLQLQQLLDPVSSHTERVNSFAMTVPVESMLSASAFFVPDSPVTRPATGRQTSAFLAAVTKTRLKLLTGSLERLIGAIARRRQRCIWAQVAFDFETAQTLVAAFTRLRGIGYVFNDDCLFDSLVLLDFLALHNLFPQWVFGIRDKSPGVHCWVQQDGVVLNDSIKHVRRYTPFLSV